MPNAIIQPFFIKYKILLFKFYSNLRTARQYLLVTGSKKSELSFYIQFNQSFSFPFNFFVPVPVCSLISVCLISPPDVPVCLAKYKVMKQSKIVTYTMPAAKDFL